MATENMTLAELLLGFGGNTLFVVGTAFITTGTIYGINRITNMAIGVLTKLPRIFGISDNKDTTVSILSRETVTTEVYTSVKIILVILAGLAIKFMGKHMNAPSTINFVNNLLYKTS